MRRWRLAKILRPRRAVQNPRGRLQSLLAAAMNAPVTVLETAGEGGAWGIALLAAYMIHGQGRTLEEYLDRGIFRGHAQRNPGSRPCRRGGL